MRFAGGLVNSPEVGFCTEEYGLGWLVDRTGCCSVAVATKGTAETNCLSGNWTIDAEWLRTLSGVWLFVLAGVKLSPSSDKPGVNICDIIRDGYITFGVDNNLWDFADFIVGLARITSASGGIVDIAVNGNAIFSKDDDDMVSIRYGNIRNAETDIIFVIISKTNIINCRINELDTIIETFVVAASRTIVSISAGTLTVKFYSRLAT